MVTHRRAASKLLRKPPMPRALTAEGAVLESGQERMPTIRILPLDVVIVAGEGATVMGAAQDAGYYWPTTCGGEGRCTTCACEIVEGAAQLVPMGRSEEKTLVLERGASIRTSNVRLACQARTQGDGAIVVHKVGVRRPLDAGCEPSRSRR